MLKTITIFCASRFDQSQQFKAYYQESLKYLIKQGVQIAYGGANDGYMGLLADMVIENQGRLLGVMPGYFDDLGRHETRCQKFYLVDSISERLTVLEALSDAFIAFPGGLGTFEEITAMLSYNAVGLIQKPVALLNIDGYYDDFIHQLRKSQQLGYVHNQLDRYLIVSDNIEEIYQKITSYHQTIIEYVDGYSREGKRLVTGIDRYNKNLNYYYKSVFLLLFDNQNRLLIQKRAKTKTYPGLWDFSVSGAVRALEEGFQGMRRETLEEIGLWLKFNEPDLTILDKHHIMEIYSHRLSETVEIETCDPEIEEIKWVSQEEWLKMYQNKETIDHPWRLEVVKTLW